MHHSLSLSLVMAMDAQYAPLYDKQADRYGDLFV